MSSSTTETLVTNNVANHVTDAGSADPQFILGCRDPTLAYVLRHRLKNWRIVLQASRTASGRTVNLLCEPNGASITFFSTLFKLTVSNVFAFGSTEVLTCRKAPSIILRGMLVNGPRQAGLIEWVSIWKP